MNAIVLVFVALLAVASGFRFVAPGAKAPRLTMLFGAGNKKSAAQEYKVNQGTANRGSYIPEGLTPDQYQQVLAAEQAKKEAKKKKFFKGKEVESLTGWMVKNEDQGLKGKDLNRKGHRMVKAKFDGWYTNESPV